MKINFQHMGSAGVFDTVHQLIQIRGMTMPLRNASEGLRNAAIQAKIEFQRKGTQQFDAAKFLGN